jgi:hypothetical protein
MLYRHIEKFTLALAHAGIESARQRQRHDLPRRRLLRIVARIVAVKIARELIE